MRISQSVESETSKFLSAFGRIDKKAEIENWIPD
jgi:hypothetical protein